ncbi:MAG: exopolysaccharide biosynthesis polyprenyl glycosylphosphotransferase [Candidatus Aegiribacteria sp.]|nr:exopolysaccharide biosynthesis polyprenyl glycosylphosphotransferase [Candidatus Aegiribacteria sp.]
MVFDGIAIFLAMTFSAWIKFDSGIFTDSASISNSVIFSGALLSVPFWWLIFVLSGSCRLHWDLSWADEMKLVVKPVTSGFIILFFGAFLVSPSASIGRWIIVFYYATLLLFVFIARGCTRVLERRLAKKGVLVRQAAIVGTGEAASSLERYLTENTALGYDIVGFVDPQKADSFQTVPGDRILGTVKDLPGIIKGFSIRELLVTIASNFHDDILSLLLPATGEGIKVKVVPDLFDIVAGHVHSTQIMGQPFMEILPERLSFWQKIVKVFIDYFISFFVLLAGLPVWIVLAALTKLDSKGPVFYRQERVGKGGKIFRVFKFRSMVNDAEKRSGPIWAGKNDSRVTRTGRYLRKSRMDEIPQLINVIRGEMSIVGPRPERPVFVEELRKIYPFYQKRLTIKPGLTGWAQVKLEYDTDIESVANKLRYDFYYIENQSIFLDLEILARTLKVVLTGAGAH